MKTETVDLTRERKLVTLAIMNQQFAQRVLPVVNPATLESAYASTVITWCKDYFEHYKKAPEQTIQDIFDTHKATVEDDTIDNVHSFLKSLSVDYDPADYNNIDYYITEALNYVDVCNGRSLIVRAENYLNTGRMEQFKQALTTYKDVAQPTVKGVSVIYDTDELGNAFMEDNESLFTVYGALGALLGNFYRGDVSVAQGGMKSSKSFFLQMLSETAASQGKKVVHINLEMAEKQQKKRFAQSIHYNTDKPCDVLMPKFHSELEPGQEPDENTTYTVIHNTRHFTGINEDNLPVMTPGISMRYKGGDIRLFTLPAESTTPQTMEALLDNLAYFDNYVCDLLVVDYAVLLNGIGSGSREKRIQIDYIYRNLRRIAQEKNIHIATVTQAGRQSLSGAEIGASDIGESISIVAHAAKVVSLYATEEERQKGIVHVKKDIDRYGSLVYDTVIGLQCLPLCKFCIDSRFASKVML